MIKKAFVSCLFSFLLGITVSSAAAALLPSFAQIKTVAQYPLDKQQETAALLAREGRYRESFYILENMLAAGQPTTPKEITYDYIVVLSWSGQHEKALAVFDGYFGKNFDALPAYIKEALAASYYKTQDFRSALNYYEQEKTPGAYLAAEKCRVFLGLVAKENLPNDIKESFALDLARINRTDEALAIYRSLLQTQSLDLSGLYDYITVLSWSGQEKEALAIFEGLPDNSSTLPGYMCSALGQMYLNQGNSQKALALYRQGVAKGDHGCILALAYYNAAHDNEQEAFFSLAKLIADNPGQPDPYIWRAKAYLAAGRIYEAVEDYDRALATVPQDYLSCRRDIQSEQAVFFLRAGECSYAAQLLAPYVKAQTATVTMQCDYLAALEKCGSYAEVVRQAGIMWPDISKVPAYGLRIVGDCYIRLGDKESAARYYAAAAK